MPNCVIVSGGTTRTATDNQSGATSYTANLGAAFGGRIIVVAVVFAGVAASGLTLAGNAMTAIASPGGISGTVAIYAIADSSNTSATLALTGAGALNAVEVYSLSGASGVSAFATGAATTNSTSLNVPAGGVIIGAGYSNNASSGYTFSGIANDATYNSGSSGGVMGSAEFASAVTPQAVSFASAGAIFRIATASWGP